MDFGTLVFFFVVEALSMAGIIYITNKNNRDNNNKKK